MSSPAEDVVSSGQPSDGRRSRRKEREPTMHAGGAGWFRRATVCSRGEAASLSRPGADGVDRHGSLTAIRLDSCGPDHAWVALGAS